MKDGSITLFLELEKAKKEYNKSLKTLISTVLLLVIFTAIALPGITKASFVGSDVINGPVIEGKPTIELDAYGIEFNSELLKTDNDAKQWETTPNEKNKIKVYVEPVFNVADIVNEKDKSFVDNGRIRYNLYFVQGENRSRVYSDKEVYVYFSPGSAYTVYKELQSELGLKKELISQDKSFYDYYMSNFLFLELYLKEALPQNGAYGWNSGNGFSTGGDNLAVLNNLLSVPTHDFLSTLKNRTTPYHAAGTDKGVYVAPYYPIQYKNMPEWETSYRLLEMAYVAKTYFPEGMGDNKELSQSDLETFYAKLMSFPGLYTETFRSFYDPAVHLGRADEFYTLSRVNINDVILGSQSHDGYYGADGNQIGAGYDYLALPTFSLNFYRSANLVSPLNYEYGFLYGKPKIQEFETSEYMNNDNIGIEGYSEMMVPSGTDNSNVYLSNNDIGTFSVYTLEKDALRVEKLAQNSTGIQTASLTSAVINSTDKIKSHVVQVRIPKASEFPKYNMTESELKDLVNSGKLSYGFPRSQVTENLKKVLFTGLKPYQAFQWFLSNDERKKLWNTVFSDNAAGDEAYTSLEWFFNEQKSSSPDALIAEDALNGFMITAHNPTYVAGFLSNFLDQKANQQNMNNEWGTSAVNSFLQGTRDWFDFTSTWQQMFPSLKPHITASSSQADKDSWDVLKNLQKREYNTNSGIVMMTVGYTNVDYKYITPVTSADGSITGTDTAGNGQANTNINGNVIPTDFFSLLIDALIRAVKFIIDLIIGNIFYWLSQLNLWVGFSIFKLAAFGTANATTSTAGGAYNYLTNVMHGNLPAGQFSTMEQGYIMLQNLSILLMVLVVVWYGFGAAVGDASGGLIAQTELKDMFPRLAVAIFMIGTTVNGHIFSGSIIMTNIILWITDSLSLAILNSDSFKNFDNLFNIANKVNAGAPDFIAAIMLFMISLVMLVLFVGAACLFVARILMIWVLVLMGPIAWLFYVSRSTQGITKTWLKMLTQTITIQFFWLIMLMIFATIFSMNFSGILGFDPNNVNTTAAGSSTTTGTVSAAPGIEKYLANSNTKLAASGSYINSYKKYNSDYDSSGLSKYNGSEEGARVNSQLPVDSSNIPNMGSYKGISNSYQDRGYYNQENVVSAVYDSNIERQEQLIQAGWWTDQLTASTATIGGVTVPGTIASSFTQIMNVLLAGMISGIFFFTLLKFTQRFAGSALMSGLNTVNGVGSALRQQASKVTSLPSKAANSTIKGIGDRVSHPILSGRKDRAAIAKGVRSAANTVGEAREGVSKLTNATKANKNGVLGVANDALTGAVEKQVDRAKNFGGELGRLAGVKHNKDEFGGKIKQFRAGTLPPAEEKKVKELMKQQGIAGENYKALPDNERGRLETAYAHDLFNTERDALAQTVSFKGGLTPQQALNQINEQLSEEGIKSYTEGVKNGTRATDHNYERLIAAKEVVEDVHNDNFQRRSLQIHQEDAKVKSIRDAAPTVAVPAPIQAFEAADKQIRQVQNDYARRDQLTQQIEEARIVAGAGNQNKTMTAKYEETAVRLEKEKAEIEARITTYDAPNYKENLVSQRQEAAAQMVDYVKNNKSELLANVELGPNGTFDERALYGAAQTVYTEQKVIAQQKHESKVQQAEAERDMAVGNIMNETAYINPNLAEASERRTRLDYTGEQFSGTVERSVVRSGSGTITPQAPDIPSDFPEGSNVGHAKPRPNKKQFPLELD